MKSFRELRRILAIGAVVLLLLPGFCGCATSVGGSLMPVPSKPTVAAPSHTQAVRLVAGAGNIGVERLSAIKPVERPIAAAPVKAQVINVLEMQGTVTAVSGGTEMPAYAGMRLSAGDKLTTGDDSGATLDLNNGGMVLVEADSALEITQSTAEYIEVSLLSGNIINNIEKGAGKYAVRANNVTMGVLGTVFRVKLDGGTARVDLYEGSVRVTLAGDGGEAHSYDLGEGMSFEGTDEAIHNSIEKGALETGELDLDELPDDAIDWIAQSLEERENTADDPETLNELINALHREIESRRKDDIPVVPPAPQEAPPVEPIPPKPPEPAQPNLVWREAGILGYGVPSDEYYSLYVWGDVENSTTPWGCGVHWSYNDWNMIETEENADSFYTYNGTRYHMSSYTGWMAGNFTYASGNLAVPFESPEAAVDSVTLDVILVPKAFDKAAPHVFDHSTVVVNNKTPVIAVVTNSDEPDGTATVTVTPPTEEIEDYKIEDSASIPVDQPSYEIAEEAAEDLMEKTAYPEGNISGMAVESVAEDGGTITVDVYLPTDIQVVDETDPDPDEPGES